MYSTHNPLGPHFIYQCIKRIFARKSHDCLSGDNKPKVIEVILKFVKLYDGTNFNEEEHLLSYFDNYLILDFMNYTSSNSLSEETLKTLIDGYN